MTILCAEPPFYEISVLPVYVMESWYDYMTGGYHDLPISALDVGREQASRDILMIGQHHGDEDRDLPPTHQNYKGTEPASEPEIKAVLALAQKQDFELAIFYHSSPTGSLAEKIFLPAIDENNPKQRQRYESLIDLAGFYADNVKKGYTCGKYELSTIPGTRMGTARNYFFHIEEASAFLIETGGVNKDGISVVHPPAAKMESIVAKHVKSLRKLFYDHRGAGTPKLPAPDSSHHTYLIEPQESAHSIPT